MPAIERASTDTFSLAAISSGTFHAGRAASSRFVFAS